VLFVLHGFSNASAQAYTAVMYLRTVQDGDISIVASKTCLAPVKIQTMELVVALILNALFLKCTPAILHGDWNSSYSQVSNF